MLVLIGLLQLVQRELVMPKQQPVCKRMPAVTEQDCSMVTMLITSSYSYARVHQYSSLMAVSKQNIGSLARMALSLCLMRSLRCCTMGCELCSVQANFCRQTWK